MAERTLGDRAYACLLYAFPADIRRAHGAAMAAHARRLRAASASGFDRCRVWSAIVVDALWSGAMARVRVSPELTQSTERETMQNLTDAVRSLSSMPHDAWPDIRLAFRRLKQAPGFAAVALLTIALGIGANTAIFSVVNAVLLAPLPFPDSGRLVGVYQVWKGDNVVFSPPNFIDLQARTKTLAAAAAFNETNVTLTGAGDPVRLSAPEVTDGFFQVLQTPPMLGRLLIRADNTVGHTDVAVLGYALWHSRFGGRRDIVGQRIMINGRPKEVVGVMPKGFAWPETAELYLPAEYDDLYTRANRGAWMLDAIGRLTPGATVDEAKSEIAAIGKQLEQENLKWNTDLGMTVHPLLDATVGDTRTALVVLLAAVAVVLLIACANVANLLLARAASRDQEFAVRAALGAGRMRVVRQLLIESLVLAGLGGLLGVGIADAGIRALVALRPAGIPRMDTVAIDARVLWYAFGAALITGVLCGLVPAIHAARAGFSDSLRERGRSAPGGVKGQRVRSVLVVSELALAVLLLVGAGLLLKSFARLTHVDPGFNPANGVTFTLSLPENYKTDAQRSAFYDRAREELNGLPGVKDTALALGVPPVPMHFDLSFGVTGWPPDPPGSEKSLEVRAADHEYFALMGIKVLRGRGFAVTDRAGTPPVVLLTESAVRTYFAHEDPIGKHIELGWKRGDSRVNGDIIGVVADAKSHGLEMDAPAQIYVDVAQVPLESMAFVLRTSVDPGTMGPAIRAAIHRIDPSLPINRLETLEQHVARSVAERRFYTLLLAIFASVALVLAAIGIFGVLSYLVSQRTREIGIRIALGASHGSVIGMVLRQSLTPASIGLGLGFAAALGLSRFLKTMLFGLTATDPATFIIVIAGLLGVAVVAAWLPARRAARVEPTAALRAQ